MILLEGPNRELRAQLGPALRDQLIAQNASLHVSGDHDRPSLQRLVKLVHADTRWQVRDGLPLGHLDADARHMIAYGLLAAGTLVVICANDGNLTMGQAEDLTPYPRVLPLYCVFPGDDLTLEVMRIAVLASAAIYEANNIWTYGGNGYTTRGPIMLVGDKPNPFVPADEGRRLAFVSHHGCSIYLHDAMRRAGGRYYVTNAYKFKRRAENLQALKDEILMVRPSKTVALGAEAAEMLSSLGTPFVATYHPQYWRRFRADRLEELVTELRP